MYIRHIFIFTIFVNCFVFGFIHAVLSRRIILSQYEGVWHIMSLITPIKDKFDPITCYQTTVIKNHDENFHQETILRVNGDWKNFSRYGEIVNSKIRLFSLGHETFVGTVSRYNYGDELIIHDETDREYYQLLSRWPGVSANTTDEFQKIATKIGAKITNVNHTYCPARN